MATNNLVTVTFDTASADPRVNFSDTAPITFNAPLNLVRGTVTFNLNVMTMLMVRFPSNPIQWVKEMGKDQQGKEILVPIDPPTGATVSRTDTSVTVTITAPPGETFRFYVIVQSFQRGNGTADGRFFGTDPTIVTMPPAT